MANVMDVLTFSLMTVLAIVIFGYFMPLVNGSAVGTATVAIVTLIPLVVAGKALLTILQG